MYKIIRYSFLFVAVSVNLMAAEYPELPKVPPAEMSCKDLGEYNSDPYPLALEENKLYQSEFDSRCPQNAPANWSTYHIAAIAIGISTVVLLAYKPSLSRRFFTWAANLGAPKSAQKAVLLSLDYAAEATVSIDSAASSNLPATPLEIPKQALWAIEYFPNHIATQTTQASLIDSGFQTAQAALIDSGFQTAQVILADSGSQTVHVIKTLATKITQASLIDSGFQTAQAVTTLPTQVAETLKTVVTHTHFSPFRNFMKNFGSKAAVFGLRGLVNLGDFIQGADLDDTLSTNL